MRAAALGMVLLCGIAQGAEPKTVTNTIDMKLVELPAGKFTMGSPAGEKDHQANEEQVAVTLTKPFWLGKTEVTQGQWKQVMGTEPWKGRDGVQIDKNGAANFVSFFDAVEFCQKLTGLERKAGKLKANEAYRLPTDAEWEYACRAGTTTAFSFGDESKLNSHAWWGGGLDLDALGKGEVKEGMGNAAREQYAHKVGLKKPNPAGLFDMHGNVAEWCSDWYGEKLSGGADPVGPERGSLRVYRGGSYSDSPGLCRSASRNDYFPPSNRAFCLGFRVARSQSEAVAEQRQQWSQAEPAPQVAAEKRPVQLEVKSNSIGMELIEIPAGKFRMGSPAGEKDRDSDEEQVAVTLTKQFALGKTEVTQGQWIQVMGTEPWKGKDFVLADKDCPATYVSFFDAVEFCDKLTDLERKAGRLKDSEEYRLPTEAEWEYACRAGTTTAFSFGDESKLNSHAWWGGWDLDAEMPKIKAGPGNAAREQYAHKAGLKKPNPWGLYDMHGNVAEWCSDWDHQKLSGGTDPVGPEGSTHRAYRGGGWQDTPNFCRSADRSSVRPAERGFSMGFRVARSQSETVAERRQQGAQAEPASQVAAAKRPVQLEVKSNSIGMELVELPAGKFTMGSPAGEKDHQANEEQVAVALTKPFWLCKTEVTQGQFKNVMGTEPWVGQRHVQLGEDNAASYVDWDEATAFCQRLTDLERKAGKLKAGESYRLPSEAEWEYACRAGTTTWYSFGDDEKQLGQYAWFDGNANNVGQEYAHKVGMKTPNPWGLYDMHGNVMEWCSDWKGEKLSGGADPIGTAGGSFRGLRGGGWGLRPDYCRSGIRTRNDPSARNSHLGFRVARSQSAQ